MEDDSLFEPFEEIHKKIIDIIKTSDKSEIVSAIRRNIPESFRVTTRPGATPGVLLIITDLFISDQQDSNCEDKKGQIYRAVDLLGRLDQKPDYEYRYNVYTRTGYQAV